jgi:hypothetical protein
LGQNSYFANQNSCFRVKTAVNAIKTDVLAVKPKKHLERGICHEQQGISSLN